MRSVQASFLLALLPCATDGAPLPADYWTEGSQIFTNAFGAARERTPLRIKGVSWFGLDNRPCQIGGLGEMSVRSGAAWLRAHGFNAVRVPLAVDALLSSDPSAGCMPPELTQPLLSGGAETTFVSVGAKRGSINYSEKNKAYVGLSYLGMLKQFVSDLGEHGLLVMLDLHAMAAGKWPDSGRVGTEGAELLESAWRLLARELGGAEYWNVFGADLKNEPHGMFWGPLGGDECEQDDESFRDRDGDGCVQYAQAEDPDRVCGLPGYEGSCDRCCAACAFASRCGTDERDFLEYYASEDRWDTLAAKLGNVVLDLAPRWLVVVEGVGHCMDSAEQGGSCEVPSSVGQDFKTSTWWGENLQAATRYPIELRLPRKLVYSPHVYGPSVSSQPYFNTQSFPQNMPAIWHTQWSTLPKLASSPVPILIGEWGGQYEGKDAQWQDALASFIRDEANQISGSFYWSFNPESGDTGGLLLSWTGSGDAGTANQAKVHMLEAVPSTPTLTSSERRPDLFSGLVLPPAPTSKLAQVAPPPLDYSPPPTPTPYNTKLMFNYDEDSSLPITDSPTESPSAWQDPEVMNSIRVVGPAGDHNEGSYDEGESDSLDGSSNDVVDELEATPAPSSSCTYECYLPYVAGAMALVTLSVGLWKWMCTRTGVAFSAKGQGASWDRLPTRETGDRDRDNAAQLEQEEAPIRKSLSALKGFSPMLMMDDALNAANDEADDFATIGGRFTPSERPLSQGSSGYGMSSNPGPRKTQESCCLSKLDRPCQAPQRSSSHDEMEPHVHGAHPVQRECQATPQQLHIPQPRSYVVQAASLQCRGAISLREQFEARRLEDDALEAV